MLLDGVFPPEYLLDEGTRLAVEDLYRATIRLNIGKGEFFKFAEHRHVLWVVSYEPRYNTELLPDDVGYFGDSQVKKSGKIHEGCGVEVTEENRLHIPEWGR